MSELHTALKAIEDLLYVPSESAANDLLANIADSDLDETTQVLLANLVQAIVTASIDGMPAFVEDPNLIEAADAAPIDAAPTECAGCGSQAHLVLVPQAGTVTVDVWICRDCLDRSPRPKRQRRRYRGPRR